MTHLSSRVWVEIDLKRIKSNFRKIARQVHPLDVMAVLKANAYGLGVKPIAAALHEAGSVGFGVADVREALEINHVNNRVHILGGLIDDEIPALVENGFIATVTDSRTAAKLSEEAQKQNKHAECHYLVDTGMGRLGMQCSQAEQVILETINLPGLVFTGIYSHFPHAYGDIAFSREQITQFDELLNSLLKKDIRFDFVHMANSDGINNIPESCQTPFNMVRTGINLYGVFDLEGRKAMKLDPVLTLKAKLIAIRTVPSGTTIGYGRTYTTQKSTVVGTVSAGYADGVPLAMSNRGSLLVHGTRCPILGTVSMDYTTISLDSVPEARVGDDVTCLGDAITVAEWAQAKATISYDIICSFGNRVERRYV